MATPITKLDEIGFVNDRKAYTLPPNAWSGAANVRFIDGSVYSSLGHRAVLGVPQVAPYYVHSTLDTAHLPIFAYCGLTKIYGADGATHADLTRIVGGNYTGTANDRWQATEFGGISIFNNGVDHPQQWSSRSLSQPMVNLANWPANTTAKVIRTFRRFLFALDVTKSGVRNSTMIKWSHEADPGTVPSSWDETDTNLSAGEYPLVDTPGPCIDALPLSDVFCVYKTDAIYLGRYIGGTFIFDLPLQFRDVGILGIGCVGEWKKKHVFLSNENEVFINDGFKYESIIQSRMRRWLATRIDSTNAYRSFVAINQAENEAWVCFPESGAEFPTIALIINLFTGAAVPRDLPGVAHIEYNKGPGSSGSTTFDSQTTPFDDMVGYFGQSTGETTKKILLAAVPEVNRNMLLQSDAAGTTWTNTNLTITSNVDINLLTNEATLDRLDATVTNGLHFLQQAMTKSAETLNFNLSVVAKADGYNYVGLRLFGASAGHRVSAIFNLATGALHFTEAVGNFSGVSTDIQSLGSGQYRVTVAGLTDTAASITAEVYVSQPGTFATFAGSGTDGILVGSMQVREGINPAVFQATTTVAARSAFFLLDASATFDGVPYTAYIERIGLPVSGANPDRTARIDPTRELFFQALWPKLELINGEAIQIQAGGQELPDSGVSWNPAVDFNPSTDLFVDVLRECRYPAVRFQSSNGEHWRLTEYDVEIAGIGRLNG